MKVLQKINISQIVINHLDTLKNDNSKKTELDDYFTFLILPIIFATLLMCFEIKLDKDIINLLITILSIFVGLLFNVIVLIFDIIKRDAREKIKNTVLQQILANISFTILLSIVTIMFSILTFIKAENFKSICTWIVYFLLFLFLLTVLMVLKRMYLLFKNEIAEIENKKGD